MDEKTKELVGISAAFAGHYRPCLIYHLEQAKKFGVPIGDINEVVDFANRIILSGNNEMYDFVYEILKEKNMENDI